MYKVPYEAWKSDRIFPMSKFRLCLTKVKEQEDGRFKEVDRQWIDGNGKQFRDSFLEDNGKGVKRSIKLVNEKPIEFIFNQIYMLPTRDVMWIWIKDEDGGSENKEEDKNDGVS